MKRTERKTKIDLAEKRAGNHSWEREKMLRIAAYQFAGSGNIDTNFKKIQEGIIEAAKCKVRMLAFHECALTGYPPLACSVDEIDFKKAEDDCRKVRKMAAEHQMFILLGTAAMRHGAIYNSVRVFTPSGTELQPYNKRALWGWDRESFTEGSDSGIYDLDGIRIGIRICFEIRFPEYFRELYDQQADLGIVCFYDTKKEENTLRYEQIKGHLQTRAVENVLPILSVNNAGNYQTAPTAFFDQHGMVIKEAIRGGNQLVIHDFSRFEDDFGTEGIRHINSRFGKLRGRV